MLRECERLRSLKMKYQEKFKHSLQYPVIYYIMIKEKLLSIMKNEMLSYPFICLPRSQIFIFTYLEI